jgi:hypothetical protein
LMSFRPTSWVMNLSNSSSCIDKPQHWWTEISEIHLQRLKLDRY